MTQIRKFTLAAITAGAMIIAPLTASALNFQLGFILDRSGSINNGNPTNWATITQGLSDAINLIPVTGPDTYEISVVTFATDATINVNKAVLNTIGDRTAAASAVAGIGFTGGWTNYADAFNKMTTALSNSTLAINASFVNFATDGNATRGGGGSNGNFDRHNDAGIAAKTALTNAGVDNISIESIGNNLDPLNLQGNYCYPGPCQTTFPPTGFPNQGFYIGVSDAAGYAAAIGNKVRVVTGQPVVPEPGTLILFGTGLAGLAAWRMRKAKKEAVQ